MSPSCRKGVEAISLEVIVTILILFPGLAAGMLALFAAALIPLRSIPAHEYQQLERAPAWLAVVTGGGIILFSVLGLHLMGARDAQVFVGSRQGAWLMIDAYGLFSAALLGAILAVAAWVPAACRSLLTRAIPYFLTILVLAWLALLLLFSQLLGLSLLLWLLLLVGVMSFYAALFRPTWRWEQMEPVLLLALAGVCGGMGLVWLRALVQGSEIGGMWSVLLSSPPRQVNGAMLLLTLGWLSPAVYLPWWVWNRRGEDVKIWVPAALLLAVSGVLVLVRFLFFIFPPGGGDFAQIPGVEHLFLIRRIVNWLLAWGMLALLLGAGWQGYLAVRRPRTSVDLFRPLVLVISGLLLLGVAGSILGMAIGEPARRVGAISGLAWTLLTWAGFITIWLAAGNLLPALTAAKEHGERLAVQLALWVSLIVLAAFPPLPGFRAMVSYWRLWQQSSTPPVLVLLALLVSAISAALLLPGWMRRQVATELRAGAAWGALAPFLLALALVACGLLGGWLAPWLSLIRQSLLQLS